MAVDGESGELLLEVTKYILQTKWKTLLETGRLGRARQLFWRERLRQLLVLSLYHPEPAQHNLSSVHPGGK